MSQVTQGARRERLTRAVAAFSLAFSLFYIAWRWGWTLNTEALWFSVPLALAETYGLLTAFFLTFTAWSLRQRRPPPAPAGRAVDVFVTTYDEPMAIIRKTALAAREMRYPHLTWILDDGHRDEVKALAGQLGVGYLRRPTREHAKAGNLNHALAHTSGEFILQLDADHVPLPQMLDRMLGFFADERVAFVQSPQDFYNTDAFTYDVNVSQRRIWEDQQLFFRVLQPGKDRVNAAFFVGSCAVIRRKAVEEVGGFGTNTITEDIETSLLLHAKGWHSVYLNESLAFGLAPATARAFHVQHLRWGQGAMQVLRRYQPLFMKGLTLSQRIGYLDSLTTYLGGFQRLILYLAPVVFFTTGAFPLRVSGTQFALVFLPYILLQVLSFKLLARGHGSLLLADRYAMAKFFTHVLAVTGYVTRKPLKFRVTPKGVDSTPLSTAVPQLAVVVLTVAALAWGVYERTLGFDEEIPGWGAAAFWVNVVFAVWNAAVAAQIVQLSLSGRHRRAEHRIAESLAVVFRVLRADGKLASTDIAVTENLNPSGLALRTMYAVPDGARVEMTLPLSTREVQVRGHIVHQGTSETKLGQVHVVGVEFDHLNQDARDAIELHCAHHALPLERQRYTEGALTAGGALRRLLYMRGERRLAVGMPARVMSGTTSSSRDLGIGLLEDVSPRGGRVLLDHPVAEGSELTLEIPGSTLRASGRVVFVHALETSLGMRFVAGFETGGDGTSKHTATRWFDEIARLTARYGVAARAQTRAAGAAAGQLMRAVIPRRPSLPAALAIAQDVRKLVAPATMVEGARARVSGAATEARRLAARTGSTAKSALRAIGSSSAATTSRARRAGWAVLAGVGRMTAAIVRAAGATVRAIATGVRAATGTRRAVAGRLVLAAPPLKVALEREDAVRTDELAARAGTEPLVGDGVFAAGAPDLDAAPGAAPVFEEQAAEPPLEEMYPIEPAEDEALLVHAGAPEGSASSAEAEAVTVAEASEPVHAIPPTHDGADTMESRQSPELNPSLNTPPLLVVRGTGALLEGSFDIEDSIEIECEVRGNLNVGGTLVIGGSGRVSADVVTVNAVILGHYAGSMQASGSIEIASTGQVNGTLVSNELVIAKGGVFTGSVSRTDQAAERIATARPSDTATTQTPKQTEPTIPELPSTPRTPAQLADVAIPSTPALADVGSSENDRGQSKERARAQELPLA